MKHFLLALLICAGSMEFSTQAAQNIETNVTQFSSAKKLYEAIEKQLIFSNMAHEQIHKTLAQWYQNNTTLFSDSLDIFVPHEKRTFDTSTEIGKLLQKEKELIQCFIPHNISATVRDKCWIIARALAFDNSKIILHCRYNTVRVLLTLNKLMPKLETNLSSKQIKIISGLLAMEIFCAKPLELSNIQTKIRLLQELAQVSNIELPEELRS